MARAFQGNSIVDKSRLETRIAPGVHFFPPIALERHARVELTLETSWPTCVMAAQVGDLNTPARAA